jgi:hypothetical protein
MRKHYKTFWSDLPLEFGKGVQGHHSLMMLTESVSESLDSFFEFMLLIS